MAVPTRHILHQGPTLKAMAKIAVGALLPRPKSSTGASSSGEVFRTTVPKLPNELIRAYVRHVGGDPNAYRGHLPPHLFPQWSFALLNKTIAGLPYPIHQVINAGCRMDISGPLPTKEPLLVEAQLLEVKDEGHRIVLTEQVTTGPQRDPKALVATLTAIIRTGRTGKNRDVKAKKERPRIGPHAEEIARIKLRKDAGLDYAKLTGDFNPIHWVAPYARAAGFRTTILHGFSTYARAYEALIRNVLAGSTSSIRTFDARFTRPLTLPNDVGVYIEASEGQQWIAVGDAKGGPAYLQGFYELSSPTR